MREFLIQRYRPDTNGSVIRPTLLRVDDQGRILQADQYAEAMFGYTANALGKMGVQGILASRQDDPFAPAHRLSLERGQPVLVTFRHKQGYFFSASLSLSQKRRDSDRAASASVTLRPGHRLDPDIQRLAEQHSGFGLWELTIATNEVHWTEGLYQLLELRPGTEISPEQALFYCQSHQSRVRALFRRCLRTGQPFRIPLQIATDRQHPRSVVLAGQALANNGQIRKLGGVVFDQSAMTALERNRQQAWRILEATTCATDDLVVALDTRFRLLHFNQPWADQFQKAFEIEPRPGDSLRTLLTDFPVERKLIERLWQRAFERGHFVAETPLNRQGESLPLYELRFQSILNARGQVTGAMHVARDISDRLRHPQHDKDQMRYDPITGLMNRRAFLVHIERARKHRQAGLPPDAILLLDLDHFERFNTDHGSGTADRYLRELARHLGARIRQRDALARLAGDTFALYLEHCPEARAREIADDIRTQIAEFRLRWQDTHLQTTCCGGLLILGPDSPPQPERLLNRAASLCHSAKTAGRNQIHTGYPRSDIMVDSGTATLKDLVARALDQNHLPLAYQSVKPLASATWGDHIEILCRIPGQKPDDPPITPDLFLPVAEQFDLASRLDHLVIFQTFHWLDQHPLMKPRLTHCSFNLSLATVLDDTFVHFMAQVIEQSRFDASCFCLEIQEAHAREHPEQVTRLCHALQGIGCKVALQEAGASVESYQLAARLPFDYIKLARALITGLANDPVQATMAEALHRIAVAAGRQTIAPFIENDETLRKARTLGIHYGQGHRLAPALPLSELTPAAVELATGRIGG